MPDPSAYCLDTLREEAADAYPALLFLPENVREDIAALHAFHVETGKIAYLVSEPMPGEIRLQWWRDVLTAGPSENRHEEGSANPLARRLLDVIQSHDLPRDGFDRYLEARTFDLYNDAMPDRTTLEAYFGETESFILQMATRVLGLEQDSRIADACGHGGVAMGLNRRLKLLARDRAEKRTYVPGDILSSAGLDRETWLASSTQNHEMAVEAMIALAREHLVKAFAAIGQLDKPQQVVFQPLSIAQADILTMKSASDLLEGRFEPSPLRRQYRLWKNALSGFSS